MVSTTISTTTTTTTTTFKKLTLCSLLLILLSTNTFVSSTPLRRTRFPSAIRFFNNHVLTVAKSRGNCLSHCTALFHMCEQTASFLQVYQCIKDEVTCKKSCFRRWSLDGKFLRTTIGDSFYLFIILYYLFLWQRFGSDHSILLCHLCQGSRVFFQIVFKQYFFLFVNYKNDENGSETRYSQLLFKKISLEYSQQIHIVRSITRCELLGYPL